MASLQNSCTENGNISADINYLSELERIWNLTFFSLPFNIYNNIQKWRCRKEQSYN